MRVGGREQDTTLEGRIRSLGREAPPPRLRGRILALAEAAERPPITLADRIWASRVLRLAWAASLAFMLLLDPLVLPGSPSSGSAAGSGNEGIGALARELDLPGEHELGLGDGMRIESDLNGDSREDLGELRDELDI